ncbi:MAG: alpha/beta fold hydrolase [Gaiellales bacterium]
MRTWLAPAVAGLALLLAGPAGAAIDWHPCDVAAGARCGHVTVPLDPTDPAEGTIRIGFELHERRDPSGRSLGTIVAVEGGPGYSTTSSRDSYLELFEPLLGRRDLLLVDNRGTGTSGPIDCRPLQSYRGDYIRNVGRCGAQLGSRSDLYGSAFAADDLALVLDALGLERVDLYGDSYGTFFGQTFAVRHPDRLRTLVLDAAYPVEGQDPWYRDLNRALRDGFTFACRRDRTCRGDSVARLARLADELRDEPLVGFSRDADGIRRHVRVDPGMLGFLAASAAYGIPVYRELDAAGRAYLAGDAAPLLRLAAEQTYWGDGGPVRDWSEGAYIAVICNDYPQLWDIASPLETREAQYEAALARLRSEEPDAFAPFTIDDWIGSPWTEYRSCSEWPAPSTYVFPVPEPTVYPTVPTLVLSGDLDSLTSPEGARLVASRFPNATFVSVRNMVHVSAIADFDRCASTIVVEFVQDAIVPDTSCAAHYNEVRLVPRFARRAAGLAPAWQGSRIRSTAADRRLVTAVTWTVGDLIPRWLTMYGSEGVGLRGGSFTTVGLERVHFVARALRYVEDVAVSGHVSWNRRGGAVRAVVRFTGPNGTGGRLQLSWNDWKRHAVARAVGEIEGRPVAVRLPAP